MNTTLIIPTLMDVRGYAMRMMRILLLVVGVGVVVGPAHASLSSELEAWKKVVRLSEDGQEEVAFEDFETALPGDEIKYRVSYLYSGEEYASNVQIMGLVPEHMVLVYGSEIDDKANVEYSTDGGNSFHHIEGLEVVSEDGSSRPAKIEDIKALRWTLAADLSPNENGSIEYIVKLK